MLRAICIRAVLLQEFGKLKGIDEIDFNIFKKMYEENDEEVQQVMDKFVKYMSVGINNILNAYNPEIVIINSSFTIHFPIYFYRLRALKVR